MTALTRNRLIGLVLAVLLFAADQASKSYVLDVMQLQFGRPVYLLPFLNFTLTYNYGVSMGMLTAQTDTMRWALVAVTALIAVVVTIWMLRERKLVDILPLTLILGGALGNIKDRYELGYVVDFVDVHLAGWHFYIFNLADAAITVGVLIILARSLFVREKAPEQTDTEPAETAVES